jgi:hypothetical protein
LTIHWLQPNVSLIFDNDELMSICGFQCSLPGLPDVVVGHDDAMIASTIQNYKKGEVLHLRADPLLAFSSNVVVGEFPSYFVADLSIGLTIRFRLE